MHPDKVDRARLTRLTDLPNIGPAMARDFVLLGYTEPAQLQGADAMSLYLALCDKTGVRQDPCVLDVFLSVVRFLSGEPPRLWWDFTPERKALLQANSAQGKPQACPESPL